MMDDTYIKVGGKNRFLYRAIDKEGNTVDFLLTKRKRRMSAQKFFNNNGNPRVINIDKSGSNYSAIKVVNRRSYFVKKIKIRQCKYLNNIVEQGHINIKRKISICTGLKYFEFAQRTLSGIEVVNIIRKYQIRDAKTTCFKTFNL